MLRSISDSNPSRHSLSKHDRVNNVLSAQSSSSVHLVSRNLLAELSSRTRTQRSPSSSQISGSSLAPTPDFLQQQRKTLVRHVVGDYLPSQRLLQYGEDCPHSDSTHFQFAREDKPRIEDLMSRLAELRENVPNTMTLIETAQAQRTSNPLWCQSGSRTQTAQFVRRWILKTFRGKRETGGWDPAFDFQKRRAAWSQELSCFSIGKDQWKGI